MESDAGLPCGQDRADAPPASPSGSASDGRAAVPGSAELRPARELVASGTPRGHRHPLERVATAAELHQLTGRQPAQGDEPVPIGGVHASRRGRVDGATASTPPARMLLPVREGSIDVHASSFRVRHG